MFVISIILYSTILGTNDKSVLPGNGAKLILCLRGLQRCFSAQLGSVLGDDLLHIIYALSSQNRERGQKALAVKGELASTRACDASDSEKGELCTKMTNNLIF